ncbi:MAG TPA: hypothetical protein VLJ79_16380 [Candidatus Binatia bacterium]|nr:hypothetical protein [Candidatus Binatia bacterium]
MPFSVETPGRDSTPAPRLNLRAAAALGCLGSLCRLFIFFLFPSLCSAEIFIEPRIGFHGVFQLGRPFPLEIELSNSGRPAEGTLEIAVWKGGATKGGVPYPLYYRRDIFLSPQSRKTVQLTVDPDFISRPLKIMFSSPSGTASREIDLRRHFSPSPVILLVSEGNTIPAVSMGSSLTNRLVALTLAELPPDPRALLGVSHLIFYDQSLRDLSRSQLLALDTWLTAGGRMVILGSLNYALYQEPAISRFLPVRVTGTKRVLFHPALGQSERASPIADVWAQAATVIAGKVLAEAQGVPVLVETSRGKGRITYLSLDVGRPPFSQWDGLPRFLQNLLTPTGGDDLAPRTRWDDGVFAQLILSPSFISTYLPTGSLFVAIVGYLIGIGVLAWLWQRRRFTRRTLIASFLFFIVLSTCGGYLLFSRGGNIPDGVLLSSTVIESSADGYVEAQSNLAMFSTQIRQYGLQMERGWMELVPVAAPFRERPEPAVVFQDGSGSSRFQLPLREWDYRLFRIRFVDRFPLRAEFEQQAGKLRMRLNNQSAKDLADCWLVVPGQRYSLGDIPRGATWTKEFSLAAEEGQERSSGRRSDSVDFRDISFKDKTREILFHSSFFPRDEGLGRWSTGAAVFFGWVKDPDRRVSVDDPRIRNYDYTLFRAIFPLAGPEDE